jgi:hypothetical protein
MLNGAEQDHSTFSKEQHLLQSQIFAALGSLPNSHSTAETSILQDKIADIDALVFVQRSALYESTRNTSMKVNTGIQNDFDRLRQTLHFTSIIN